MAMKKRHEQKLILLSVVLLFLLNIPIVLIYNTRESIMGFPKIYFVIFMICLSSVFISYLILSKFHD